MEKVKFDLPDKCPVCLDDWRDRADPAYDILFKPGYVAVCSKCGAPFIFDELLKPVFMSEADLNDLKIMCPSVWQELQKDQERIKYNKSQNWN
jgi:hypothetical protein